MKNTYTATFKDGAVITRKSEREYHAAWRVTVDGGKKAIAQGFSQSIALARNAADAAAKNTKWGDSLNGQFTPFCQRGPVVEIAHAVAA